MVRSAGWNDGGVVDVLEHLEARIGAGRVRIELVRLRAGRRDQDVVHATAVAASRVDALPAAAGAQDERRHREGEGQARTWSSRAVETSSCSWTLAPGARIGHPEPALRRRCRPATGSHTVRRKALPPTVTSLNGRRGSTPGKTTNSSSAQIPSTRTAETIARLAVPRQMAPDPAVSVLSGVSVRSAPRAVRVRGLRVTPPSRRARDDQSLRAENRGWRWSASRYNRWARRPRARSDRRQHLDVGQADDLLPGIPLQVGLEVAGRDVAEHAVDEPAVHRLDDDRVARPQLIEVEEGRALADGARQGPCCPAPPATPSS